MSLNKITNYNITTPSSFVIKSTVNSTGIGSGGSLTVLGGVSVSKDLFVGTNITANNIMVSSTGSVVTSTLGINSSNFHTIGNLFTNTSGNVGVNTTSPSYTLDVNGGGNFLNSTLFKTEAMAISSVSYGNIIVNATSGSFLSGNTLGSSCILWNQCTNSGGWSTSTSNGAPGGHFVVGVTGIYNVTFSSRVDKTDNTSNMYFRPYYGTSVTSGQALQINHLHFLTIDPDSRRHYFYNTTIAMTAGNYFWFTYPETLSVAVMFNWGVYLASI